MSESFFDRIQKNKQVHTPDVLSCLANLSNDEVFTPPEVVNKMLDLLPQEIFEDPNAKFFDPACKTGVFLREIAKRLLVGIEPYYPDLQERIDHIFHKQLFGIAITELTSLLSRRSLYCSKYPNGRFSISHFENVEGNIKFKKIKHTWKDGKCVYCGANKKEYDRDISLESHAYEFIHIQNLEELKNMKFDVIISNPPYHLNDGGGTGSSAMPIYNYFIEQAIKLNPKYLAMIIPARWYAGGKGLDKFREEMLNDTHISTLVDYKNSADCFPGVTIAGGICYFLRDRSFKGQCNVINISDNKIISRKIRSLDEYNVFVRDNLAIDIIRKVVSKDFIPFSNLVSSRNSFNLFSKEVGHPNKNNYDLTLYSLQGKSYIEPSKIVDRDSLLNKYKVIMTKAMSGGNKPMSNGTYQVISSTIRVLKPQEVCTETYLCVGSLNKEEQAINLCNYMKTKFFRFLLLQSLSSINISKEKFQFIPTLDFSKEWTDKELYKKYNLKEEEISLIESTIKSMDGE